MGMFDYVVCELPLPGRVPAWLKPGHLFQTKDTPPQALDTFRIKADRTITHQGYDADHSPQKECTCVGMNASIEFRTNNICGVHGPALYTRDGEDAVSLAYVAVVVNGIVVDVQQTECEVRPAWAIRPPGRAIQLSNVDQKKLAERLNERLLGTERYVRPSYASLDGYKVRIVFETDQELVALALEASSFKKAGSMEILDRNDRDRTHFDTKADAEAHYVTAQNSCNERIKKWEAFAASWKPQEPAHGQT